MPSLKWIGKKEIKNHHNHVEYRVIDCKETIGETDTGNLIVKGDNLLALKALLPYYAGKVKMIYIDPPYNTGNTSWVYNDAVDSPIIKKWLAKTVDITDLSRTDKWLCMIYPRLQLLKQFLREDGVIFISIDDTEIATLRMVMDEIFGKNNFISEFIWNAKQGKLGTTEGVAVGHEYILCYARNSSYFEMMKITTVNEKSKNERLRQWGQGDTREARSTMYFPLLRDTEGKISTITDEEYNRIVIDSKLKIFDDIYAQELQEFYEKKGYEVLFPIKDNGDFGRWRVGLKTARELLEQGLVFFEESNNGKIEAYRIKEAGNITTTALDSVLPPFTGKTANGTTLLKQIFEGKEVFDYPKPPSLIQYLMKMALVKDEDIVLDSFAGSGTTGHSVLEQNRIDGMSRKFILIEMEKYAKELTAERIRRVIDGYSFTGKIKKNLIEPIKLTPTKLFSEKFMKTLFEELNEFIGDAEQKGMKIEKKLKDNVLIVSSIQEVNESIEGLGGGFQYCELTEPMFDEFGLLNEHINFSMLAKHIFFTEFGVAASGSIISENNHFVGSFEKTALYLFLDKKFNRIDLKHLSHDYEKFIVYADSTSLSDEQLKQNNIVLKKLPFDVKDK